MIPLLLFLLACTTIYIGTVQAAFSTLLRMSLRLIAERNGRSDLLGRHLDEPILLLVPTRILLGVATALATILVTRLVGDISGQRLWIVLGAMVAYVVVCEHLLPLLIARRDPERVAEFLLPSFSVATRLFRPLSMALVRLVASRRERTPVVGDASAAEDESETAEGYLDVGEQQGLIEHEERRLLRSIFDFGDTLVREVMTPRPDIVAIRADATVGELRALFQEQEYSRIPVFKDNLDNIVGLVFIKDLLQTGCPADDARVAPLIRPAHVVPETKRVADLLKEFQTRQVQLAIVVDEYGGTAGLVTLEDLLEEIVGEIRDEYDVEAELVMEEGEGTFVFSGKVDIDELTERLDVEIEREGFETVGGYILARLGRVPGVGEVLELDGLHIEVLEAERRRVNKIRVRRTEPVAVDETT